MPLFTVRCVPSWLPPEDDTVASTPQQTVTLIIVRALPGIVADAFDRVDVYAGLTADEVRVDIAWAHLRGQNISDVQILGLVGGGSSHYEVEALRKQTADLRDAVCQALQELRRTVVTSGAPWPQIDIDLLPVMMVGLSVDTTGRIAASWGDPSDSPAERLA
jgi:hypothetical protein